MFPKNSIKRLFPNLKAAESVSHQAIAPKLPITHWCVKHWINRSFRTKLTVLLILGAGLPTSLVLYGMANIAKQQLLTQVQASLQQDLNYFQQQMAQVNQENALLAAGLATQAESLAPPDAVEFEPALPQTAIDRILQHPAPASLPVSFYLLTDAQGRVIGQNIQVLNADPKALEPLPQANQAPPIQLVPQSLPIQADLGQVPIVRDAIAQQQALSGYEIAPATMLQQLGLDRQADIGLRPQKTTGLTDAKKPLPAGTYNLEQGKMGLVSIAVQPIKRGDRVIGMAIVGTLLNRDSRWVDRVQQKTGVSTATIFAYDWRISTNVPMADGKNRAIGTRAAREVAETVLQQGKTFLGQTNIVGQEYLTAYAPLYDHRVNRNPAQAKPMVTDRPKVIGILYVGDPMAQVHQSIGSMLWIGYSIGAGVLLVVCVLAVPLAHQLSEALQKLTRFAQKVGGTALPDHTDNLDAFAIREDEIGILARELGHMTDRIEQNLTAMRRSESQTRQQAAQLQAALTELQQAQVQLVQTEKMSSLGQLVAGIAHEINNPIGFIHGNLKPAIGYVDDLFQVLEGYQAAHPPGDDLQATIDAVDLPFIQSDLPKLLNSMQMGTQRIREIVLSLRNFSRLDEADMKAVDIHEGLDNTLLILQHRLKPKHDFPGIEVVKEYGDLPNVECYAGQLNQVFMNLIGNAIDALEEHKKTEPRRITIRTEIVDAVAIVRICDNGCGIPDELQNQLFDPFFTTKEVGKGTGLGLSISYQIITDRHQGTLVCCSAIGQGTTFVIRLPQLVGAPEAIQEGVLALVG
jgi:signal transduction histidine kinase